MSEYYIICSSLSLHFSLMDPILILCKASHVLQLNNKHNTNGISKLILYIRSMGELNSSTESLTAFSRVFLV